MFKTVDAELCGIDACWWIKSPFYTYGKGRAFCQPDFARRIVRIRRDHGADAALVPAGFSHPMSALLLPMSSSAEREARIQSPAVRSPRFVAKILCRSSLTRGIPAYAVDPQVGL